MSMNKKSLTPPAVLRLLFCFFIFNPLSKQGNFASPGDFLKSSWALKMEKAGGGAKTGRALTIWVLPQFFFLVCVEKAQKSSGGG